MESVRPVPTGTAAQTAHERDRKGTAKELATLPSGVHFSPYNGQYCNKKSDTYKRTKAAIARGFHLVPVRTEKLHPAAPMVLRKRESR